MRETIKKNQAIFGGESAKAYAVAILTLFYSNKSRAYKEVFGDKPKRTDVFINNYFETSGRSEIMTQAKSEFNVLMQRHFELFAIKTSSMGVMPKDTPISEQGVEEMKAMLTRDSRSKEDVVREINNLIDSTTDVLVKRDYYKLLVEIEQMKKDKDDNNMKDFVVVLPAKSTKVCKHCHKET